MLNIEEFADSNELFDGHYALIRPLSVDGATADVWLSLDMNTVTEHLAVDDIVRLHDDEIEKIGLMVAIKIYRPQNALDIEGEQRFREEYMIVYNCNHTNLIHPNHFSIFRETPYLVLPYCKLGSAELLVGNDFSGDNAWKFIQDVASGMAYLHAMSPPIIHQDIKPANILLDDNLNYAITDFGISAQRGGVHDSLSEDNSGTFAYMAPERFVEDAVPMPQSDIWAFGATLYEILTGRMPFGEDGGKAQAEGNLPVPAVPNASPDIQRLVAACLAKEPGDRPSASALVEAARMRQYPVRSRKWLYAALAVLSVLLIGVVSYFLGRPSTVEEIREQPIEEAYKNALDNLDSHQAGEVRRGIEVMDSLGKKGYTPALHQMALTYGWYSDTVAVRRKKMLGINVDKEGAPTEDAVINKAVGLFSELTDKPDSLYPEYVADANYRLAMYYLQFFKDFEKSESYLRRSKEWAALAEDDNLLERIDRNMENIERYKEQNRP